MKPIAALACVASLALGLSALFAAEPKPATQPTTRPAAGNKVVTPSGLSITVVEEAKNPGAMPGDIIWMHYTGRLADGKQFDSSVGQKPFKFTLGTGEVIKGWDEGVVGMKVGEKRTLVVPPALGYGPDGQGPIPGNATLTFDIEMIGMARPVK